jgi:hypothetical protein
LKKILLVLTLLIGVAFSSYAQDDNTTPKLGIGFSLGANTGTNSGPYPIVGGVHFKFEYPLSNTPLSLVFTTGYTFYGSGGDLNVNYYDNNNDTYAYTNVSPPSFVPVEVGAKYYIVKKLFAEGDVGAVFNVNPGSIDEGSKPMSKVSPIIAPSIGYTIPFGRSRASVDLSLGFEANPQSGSGDNQALFKATFNFGM